MALKKNTRGRIEFFGLLLSVILLSMNFVFAAPVNPDSWNQYGSETKAEADPLNVTISGGVIAKFNLTATVQNPRWKAFVGEVIGKFTLDGGAGSTIYDWTLNAVSGRVYASTSDAITWSSIACATGPDLEAENTAMSHTGASDNITATFRKSTHDTFFVGATSFAENDCDYALNTYDNGGVDQDALFDEVALSDGSNIVYATLISDDSIGFDGGNYDFQMIVPENGAAGFTGATPYYMYVEIN